MFIVYMDFLSRPISSSYHVAYRTPRASTTAHYVEAELLSVGLLGLLYIFLQISMYVANVTMRN